MFNRRSSLDDSSLESALQRRRPRLSIAPKHDVIPEHDVKHNDVIRSRSSLLVRLKSDDSPVPSITDGGGEFSFKPSPSYAPQNGATEAKCGVLKSKSLNATPRSGAIQRCSSVDSLLSLGLRILEDSLNNPASGECSPSSNTDAIKEEDETSIDRDSDNDVIDFDVSGNCDVITSDEEICEDSQNKNSISEEEKSSQNFPSKSATPPIMTSQSSTCTSLDDVDATQCGCADTLRQVALSNQELREETRQLRDDVRFLEEVMRKVIKHVGYGKPRIPDEKSDSPEATMRYTLDNLSSVTEEAILEKLLYEAEEFDDRRKIRRAIRDLRKKKAENGGVTKENTTKSWSATKTTSSTATRALPNGSVKTESKETTSVSGYQRKTASPLGSKRETDVSSKSLADKYSLGSSYSSTRKDMSSTSTKKVGSIFDREDAAGPKRSQTDKRREVMRNRSMPAPSAKDARKMFTAMDNSSNKGTGGKKVGRSPTFVVPNANNVKQMLLKWCQAKTRGYDHVDINNFSGSWASGMAFCALVHNFFPEAFDYSTLDPKARAKNFTLAFDAAEKYADADQLLDVEDMMIMGNRPDSKCVFTYVQSLYNKLRRFEKPLTPLSPTFKVMGGLSPTAKLLASEEAGKSQR
ncbi:uncharacterized protein LOC104266557 isoform X2 [Ciona intestinalis]